jgi:CBS domain-containing protein
MIQRGVVKQGGIMQVSEVMSKGIVSANVDDSIKRVAEMMKQEDVGALPVLENNETVGFITDRDIVVSCIAEGDDLQQPIRKAMTKDVFSVTEDQDVEEASRLMQQHQVSRVLVMDKQKKPVGMVSLKDLSQEDEDLSAETVSKIKDQ